VKTGTAIALGAAVLGGVYLLTRRRQTPPVQLGGGDPCDELSGTQRDVCRGVRTVANLVDKIIPDNKLSDIARTNNKLNGKCKQVFSLTAAGNNAVGITLAGSCMEYENGCRPIDGCDGKCRAGTITYNTVGLPVGCEKHSGYLSGLF